MIPVGQERPDQQGGGERERAVRVLRKTVGRAPAAPKPEAVIDFEAIANVERPPLRVVNQ